MTSRQQIEAFDKEIRALIERFANEFDLSHAAAIGVLTLHVHELCRLAHEAPDENDRDGVG